MRHIESKSGESYPIISMDKDHLLNTINLLLRRCRKIQSTKDFNPRYFDDIESNLERLAQYYFTGDMLGYLNPILKQEIENVVFEYREDRSEIVI